MSQNTKQSLAVNTGEIHCLGAFLQLDKHTHTHEWTARTPGGVLEILEVGRDGRQVRLHLQRHLSAVVR